MDRVRMVLCRYMREIFARRSEEAHMLARNGRVDIHEPATGARTVRHAHSESHYRFELLVRLADIDAGVEHRKCARLIQLNQLLGAHNQSDISASLDEQHGLCDGGSSAGASILDVEDRQSFEAERSQRDLPADHVLPVDRSLPGIRKPNSFDVADGASCVLHCIYRGADCQLANRLVEMMSKGRHPDSGDKYAPHADRLKNLRERKIGSPKVRHSRAVLDKILDGFSFEDRIMGRSCANQSRVLGAASRVRRLRGGCRHDHPEVLRLDQTIRITDNRPNQDAPFTVSLLEDVEIPALMPEIEQFCVFPQAVDHRPLGFAECPVPVDVDDRVRDRMNAAVYLFQHRDHVVAEFPCIAAEEAVIIKAIRPVARLEAVDIASVSATTVAVYDVSDCLTILKRLQRALKLDHPGFDRIFHHSILLHVTIRFLIRPIPAISSSTTSPDSRRRPCSKPQPPPTVPEQSISPVCRVSLWLIKEMRSSNL